MPAMNSLLSTLAWRVSRAANAFRIPGDFKKAFARHLAAARKNHRGFRVFRQRVYEGGAHPYCYIDFECVFAAQHIAARRPTTILDVGSYRYFLLGLLSCARVTTLDVRERAPAFENEIVLTGDAKRLNLAADTFDAVVSLGSLEHFGLGRYGDAFDLDADLAAFQEMVRVLRPGGVLVFSTTITRADPQIVFNAHRIYSHAMIRSMCRGLELVEERFFSHRLGRFCALEHISKTPRVWDIYCGCWTKP